MRTASLVEASVGAGALQVRYVHLVPAMWDRTTCHDPVTCERTAVSQHRTVAGLAHPLPLPPLGVWLRLRLPAARSEKGPGLLGRFLGLLSSRTEGRGRERQRGSLSGVVFLKDVGGLRERERGETKKERAGWGDRKRNESRFFRSTTLCSVSVPVMMLKKCKTRVGRTLNWVTSHWFVATLIFWDG